MEGYEPSNGRNYLLIEHCVTSEWTFHPMVSMKENSLEFHATGQVNFTDCGLQDFKHISVHLFIHKFKI